MKELLLIAVLLAPALGQLGLSPSQMGVVTGRLSRNGQPAAGIRVTAMAIPEPGVRVSDAASFASIALTDTDGRYRLDKIPSGRYYVTAGFLDVPTYYPGVASIGSAKAVNVEAGVTTEGIDFTTAVSAGVNVSGRVIFPPGQMIPPNQRFSLAGPTRPAPEAVLNPDGSFAVSRVRPGIHTLQVRPLRNPPWAATVVVGDVDISGVDIEIPHNVAGTVVVDNDGPLPNISFVFTSTRPDGAQQNVTVSPTGAFSSQLTPGDYRLTVTGLPEGYTLKSVTAGSADLLANPLRVSAASAPVSVTLGVASPPPWVKVSGKVTGRGVAPAGVWPALTLTGKVTAGPITFDLAADGSFELPKVLPGDYTLGVTAPFPRAVALHVGSQDVHDVEIAIPTNMEVIARVTAEGQPAGGCVVTQQAVTNPGTTTSAFSLLVPFGCTPNSLEVVLTDTIGATPINATRQPDGTFRMRLPEGERRVTADVTGYTVKSLSYGAIDLLKDPVLKVSSADTAQLEMTLVKSAAGSATALVNTAVYVGSDVAQANLVSSAPPVYPPAAAGIHEAVVLRANVDKEGVVANLAVVQGHPLLNEAALQAVKQWRYRPQVLNGQPSSFATTIHVPPQ